MTKRPVACGESAGGALHSGVLSCCIYVSALGIKQVTQSGDLSLCVLVGRLVGNVRASHVASQMPKHQIESQRHGGNVEKVHSGKHYCRNSTSDKANNEPQPMAVMSLNPAYGHQSERYPCKEWRQCQNASGTTADDTRARKHERSQDSDSSESPRSHCYRNTSSRGALRFRFLNRIHEVF